MTRLEEKYADFKLALKLRKGEFINFSFTIFFLIRKFINYNEIVIFRIHRDTKKVTQHIQTLETNVRDCEDKIREIQKEKIGLEERAKELLIELNKVNELLVEEDEISASFKTDLNALQERENKMKAVKIELDQKVKTMTKNFQILEQKISDYTKKVRY